MSLRIRTDLANKMRCKTAGQPGGSGYNKGSFILRAVEMKHSRTEVGRWRMLRQASRRKARWLEAQSRRNMRIHSIRKCLVKRQRQALVFALYDI
ncbi:hypothetical protein GM31_14040 [Trabulsiella odontotermitis]|uniref:Uncharacterized protein YciY n=2 Tax=Trabulsiella odontotermitis TaxID=379893 RepID=A0A0L0H0P8_9ENTR|nr:hypothetical protein GM30_10675 [Trabulsiella odontotermitis]KNC94521.1 hypothetical protein GM31_14040 [Trabulsiella odontotermitis]